MLLTGYYNVRKENLMNKELRAVADNIIAVSYTHLSMDIAHVAGIVAEKGGDTAHASILARALEIPACLLYTSRCV